MYSHVLNYNIDFAMLEIQNTRWVSDAGWAGGAGEAGIAGLAGEAGEAGEAGGAGGAGEAGDAHRIIFSNMTYHYL